MAAEVAPPGADKPVRLVIPVNVATTATWRPVTATFSPAKIAAGAEYCEYVIDDVPIIAGAADICTNCVPPNTVPPIT